MLDAVGAGCRLELQPHHLPRERHDAILGRGPTVALDSVRIARARRFDRDMVEKRRQTLPWFPFHELPYPVGRL